MSPRNARLHLVHVGKETESRARLICSDIGVYRMGDRVLVEMSPGLWRRGHVDHRAPSGPGGVIMVTLLA